MSKKVIRLITLVLAIAMVASVAVGCNNNGDNPGSTPGGTGNNPGSSIVDGKVNGMLDEVNPADYRGTKVVLATRTDPFQNEDGPVCDKFEQEYGIDFDFVLIKGAEYVSTIAGRIASEQQTDVYYENGDFPGSLTVMQPLDNAKFDLTAPIWNQALIKASTLDGHPYLVDAISNVWTELDICVYNKSIFDEMGLTTPEELYNAGKWTFANFRELAKQISAFKKEYIGAGVLDEAMLGAAGCSVFLYEDNQMKLGVDKHFYTVLTEMAKMRADGYIKLDRTDFNNGKIGMAFTNCYGLKRTGYYTTINPDHLRATYLPVWEEGDKQVYTGIYRGWGLIDGSTNPVGAGLFIRYYIDVNNYDLDKTFHNQDVANFFFKLVGEYPENVLYYRGPDMINTTGMGERFGYQFQYSAPDQIATYLDSKKPTMELMIEKANEIIEVERDWIKYAEQEGLINKVN